MLCLNGFELYSRWVPLNYVEKGKGRKQTNKQHGCRQKKQRKTGGNGLIKGFQKPW